MRNHKTLAVVISSMLMAATAQAQPAPTDTTSSDTATTQSQTETSGTMSTMDADMSTDAGAKSNSSHASAMAQQRWSEADTDRNGNLSQAEMQASMPTVAANFSKMDANGDGQLSHDEMHNFKLSDKDNQWNQDFKAADTDRDGSVTLAEAQNGLPTIAPHFATIDADKDGKLSRDEMAAHQRSMKSSDSSMDADTSTRTSTSTTTTTTESDKSDASDKSNR